MLCGFNIVGVSRGEMDRRKQTTMFIMVRFEDAPGRPPTPWVPSFASLSPIPLSSKLELPTSLWKGEGRMQQVHISE